MHPLSRHSLHSAQQSQVKVAVLADTVSDRDSLSWQEWLGVATAIAAILTAYSVIH